LIDSDASSDDKNAMTARAASESLVVAATPAENMESFCTSGGNGVVGQTLVIP